MIYFTQDRKGGPVKIGFSMNVDSRIATLRTETKKDLVVLGVHPGLIRDEYCLHNRFREECTGGEWFRLSRRLKEYIAANTKPWTQQVKPDQCKKAVVRRIFIKWRSPNWEHIEFLECGHWHYCMNKKCESHRCKTCANAHEGASANAVQEEPPMVMELGEKELTEAVDAYVRAKGLVPQEINLNEKKVRHRNRVVATVKVKPA